MFQKCLHLAIGMGAVCGLIGCAAQPGANSHSAASAKVRHMQKVRTTAYTHTERGGRRNALGKYLSGRHVISAASDWSRFPLGTRFRIAGANDEYIIDDYGTALIGTNTIDLYKPSRLEMKRWGVRHVDIDVLQWGSEEQSLKVLGPRAKHRYVRRMIIGLEKKKGKAVAQVSDRTSL
jgi:3D (Asp-Asp-Asp) domain-containing protein